MKRKLLTLLAGALFSTFTMGASLSAQTTQDVWQHHIDAWVAQDLDAIAADYTEESLLILNNEVFRGSDEIRDVFAKLFEIFEGGDNVIDPAYVDGRIVYITWRYQPEGFAERFFGTDTFVIEDGKIAVQTIGSNLYDHFPILAK